MAVIGSRSILVLRALGLGDFLTAVPALRALRWAFPEHRIVLAEPEYLQPLAHLCGAVDEVLPADPLQEVDFHEPDIAVNLHGSGPESHRVLLTTRPRRLIAFANAEVPETRGLPCWREKEHEVDRWCRLLEESGICTDRRALWLPVPSIAPPPFAEGATLVHPGAASNARRWPADRWAEVVRSEMQAGHEVAISAGSNELELAQRIARLAGLHRSRIIHGTLLKLAAAVAAAHAVVCGDTGVAHLATAFGTPAVILFGPVAPSLWGPPLWHPHVALWSGGRGDPHATDTDPGLLLIEPADVTEALQRLEVAA